MNIMDGHESIDILMSTYNGHKYVSSQIDSIINQQYKNWRLLIRDDGSKDSTVSIIKNYVKTFPDKTRKSMTQRMRPKSSTRWSTNSTFKQGSSQ